MLISAMVGHLILEERSFFAAVASCIVFLFTPALYALYTTTQPNLEIIRKLRDQQGISTMVEMDGGWSGQRVEVNTALAATGRECPAGIAGPRRRACGGA
jgi:hypothetical protein